MAQTVLVLGASGSGKSTSLRNFKDVGIIQCVKKSLPFKSDIKTLTTDNYATIKGALLKSNAKSIVIDDSNYLMTNAFMRRINDKGYDKFSELGFDYFDLIHFAQEQVPDDKIVYFFTHEEVSDATGNVKPKTLGKLLDDKVCVEGLFTTVIRCIDHKFYTNNCGCAKSPIDMFAQDEIENDLALVDKAIRDYYNIGGDK